MLPPNNPMSNFVTGLRNYSVWQRGKDQIKFQGTESSPSNLVELGPWSCWALFLFGFLSIAQASLFSNLDADILEKNIKNGLNIPKPLVLLMFFNTLWKTEIVCYR